MSGSGAGDAEGEGHEGGRPATPPSAMPFSALQGTIKEMASEEIARTLGGQVYKVGKVPEWTSELSESLLKRLVALKAAKKFIVTCSILEKKTHSIGRPGFHHASTCFWDPDSDGVTKVPWESSSMHCIVCVFGVAL